MVTKIEHEFLKKENYLHRCWLYWCEIELIYDGCKFSCTKRIKIQFHFFNVEFFH